MSETDSSIDKETEEVLNFLQKNEKVRFARLPAVRTVFVVLSASGMPFAIDGIRRKILLSYSDAAIFFCTACGNPIGLKAPRQLDLVIDFSGSGQRQPLLFPKKLRRMSRVVVGRKFGLLRPRLYDRLLNEKEKPNQLPKDYFERERYIQTQILALAGVAMSHIGELCLDRSKTIANEWRQISE